MNTNPRTRRAIDPATVALGVLVTAVLAFMVLPLLIIVPMSFGSKEYLSFPPSGFTWHWYSTYFESRQWRSATLLSLSVAALTAATVTIVGTMATYALIRSRSVLRTPFQLLLIGPIVVPHIALAAALFLMFDKLGLTGTLPGFVLAHSVLAMPFFVFTVAAALLRVSPELESAAMSCGASRFSAFRLVTLPLILPNVLSGALFAFIISFDEPVVSFFLSGIRTQTLPRRMFDDIEQNLTPVIPAIATLLIAISLLALALAYLLKTMTREPKTLANDA